MFLQFLNPNNSGAPAVGFQLFTYAAGTTTKQATWTDSSQGTQNANPLTLDANGRAVVWGDPTLSYKFVLAPANSPDPPTSPVWTQDDIGFPLDLAVLTQALIGGILYPQTSAELAAGVTPSNYQYEPCDVRRYMSAAQLADVLAGTVTVDQTSAVTAAIAVCGATTEWAPLLITGRLLINPNPATSQININRLVDTTSSDFRIVGIGPGAGFYTTGDVTVFGSSLSGTGPQSEFVTFENCQFETSSVSNTSYVMSGNFLRVRFFNCRFFGMACVTSSDYGQSIYFLHCNIRNCLNTFVDYVGSYDIAFLHNIIENNYTVFKSVDTSRGTNGFRFLDNLLEGGQAISIEMTGATAQIIGNYFESQAANDFNFFAGTITNNAIEFRGNIILNPQGPTCYFGPTTALDCGGNSSNSGASVTSSGVSITSGTASLTVDGASFTSANLNMAIAVPGAGLKGATLITTISEVTSSTEVTLAANASTTLSSAADVVNYGWPLYSNAVEISDAVSAQDTTVSGIISDAPTQSLLNGILRFGASVERWWSAQQEITKDTSGNFGINCQPLSTVKLFVQGADQTDSNYATVAADSVGNTILACRDDRQLLAPALSSGSGTALVLTSGGLIQTQSSSRRYKEAIEPIDIGLHFIRQLRPVRFRLKADGTEQCGLIAEDFPDPRFVSFSRVRPDDPQSELQVESINYAQLVAPLIKAVQELAAQVQALQAGRAHTP